MDLVAQDSKVPLWEKITLTIPEASELFGIGQVTIREIVKENIGSNFVLKVGKKYLIKRKSFEEYINRTNIL